MAEGLLRKYAKDRFDAQSAGTEPKGLNPLAVEAMREIGIDISQQRSKDVSEFLGKVSLQYAIFVCSSADERCPALRPFSGERLYWPFEDPAAAAGSHEEKLTVFRDVRDQIEAQLLEWLAELRVAGKFADTDMG
jgi:arsenate reductase